MFFFYFFDWITLEMSRKRDREENAFGSIFDSLASSPHSVVCHLDNLLHFVVRLKPKRHTKILKINHENNETKTVEMVQHSALGNQIKFWAKNVCLMRVSCKWSKQQKKGSKHTQFRSVNVWLLSLFCFSYA